MPLLSRWWARRLLTIAHYCHARGDLDEALRYANRALRIATRTGPVRLYALATMTAAEIGTDGVAYAPSRALAEEAVRLLETAPSGESRLLARALTCLGDNHRRAGHYPEATIFLGNALHLLEHEDPPNPVQLARVLTALGIAAKDQGAYAEAARRYATIADMYDRDGAPLTARATLHHNLAGLAYAQQQYPRAEAHARQAVALRRRARASRAALAADVAVLAASIAAQGRYDEARDHLGRALASSRAARPPRYYDIAVQLHLLATIDHETGQMDQAERRYREALSIKERLLGHTHPEIANLCDNLATLLHDRRRVAEAAECPQHHPTASKKLVGREERHLA
jgi:tetratricopeptide (TPR) repeat protein